MFYCFLDGYSGYYQIEIALEDQGKTTFTCPFATFAFRRMPFGLCNAPATFQRCKISIFSDMVEKFLEVFMDDLSVFGDFFDNCLNKLKLVLARCEEKCLVLNWGKCHFMVTSGTILKHVMSSRGIEVDKAKIDLILNLPTSKTVKDVVKNEVIKLLDKGIIYPISDSKWVSPTQVVPKKSGMTVVKNENNEMIPT